MTTLLFCALVWLCAPFAIGQTTPQATTPIYVCDCQPGADGDCVAGSDANDGLAPATAWQTVEQARSYFNNNISAGDEIRFCRGGLFDLGSGGSRWRSSQCSAEQPCVVADYAPPWASGDEARPILLRPIGDFVFDLANPGNAIADHGYVFRNLDLRCTGCTDGGWGFFFFNDVNDVTIENVDLDGFAIGIHLAGANPCQSGDPLCNGQNDRVTIRNVRITNSHHQGILGGANQLRIEDSHFENNGNGTVFDHNIYISSGSDIVIRGNELTRSSLDEDGNCGGTSLVGHGQLRDLLIEGNWVHEDVGKANQGCWGISITTGYSTPESFTNVTVRNNRVENVGNVAIGLSACISCTVENNVIVHAQPYGATAVAVPDIAGGPGDAVSQDMRIRNNSIAVNGGSTAIRLAAGSGHTVVSNAIRATTMNSAFNCFDLPLGTSAYTVVDYNLCHFIAGEWAHSIGDLASWQAQGWESHGRAVDPGFVTDTDLQIAAPTSAVVDAGHPTLSSSTDRLGRVRDAQPDAGAYEWIDNVKYLWLPIVLE
ncbi:MAG: right-handed parallel beta-helix repeat-containing protein [Caldilineaceae bacterium]